MILGSLRKSGQRKEKEVNLTGIATRGGPSAKGMDMVGNAAEALGGGGKRSQVICLGEARKRPLIGPLWRNSRGSDGGDLQAVQCQGPFHACKIKTVGAKNFKVA